jgi:Cu+-exporting ATPase
MNRKVVVVALVVIAAAVARKLGIDEVVAEVLPDQKVEAVRLFQQKGRIVAMAGDGSTTHPRWLRLT